ncbi:hypothetical protein FBALC1_15957 [Flavobacteriales bacterium ALC-1]|nr:hypothetical protein FBALC1_15957 [Flavobacteriales bacterium ALC-1]
MSQLIIGQNISGTILDSISKQPLENVTVYLQKNKTGTVSDASGKFKLSLNSRVSKTDSVQFSCIGYHSIKMTITELRKRENTILLSKKLETLNEVVVNSPEKLNPKIKFKKLSSLKSGVFAFGSQVIGNNIYVISGNSSYIEDSGKKALAVISEMPRATLSDLIKELFKDFNYEGYSDKLQIYDILNNKWSTSKTKFRKRAYHNLNCYGNSLYSIGGKRLSSTGKYEYLDDKIEVYDMGLEQITIDHTNPHQAINFASITYEDNIIVMGGSTKKKKNGKKVYTDVAHIYNITSGKWFKLPRMTTAKETQGIIIDDKIYLVGGFNGSKLNTIESYDIKTATWKNEGQLFYEMENPALTSHKHIIYIFNDDKLSIYNTHTKALVQYDINLKLEGAQMHYYQNKLYVIGGSVSNSHTTARSSHLYVIDIDEFSKTTPINYKTIN